MKKLLLSVAVVALFYHNSNACSWYDPDYEYFNLFTQNIIKDKSLTPFLLTYSNKYYAGANNLKDQNIVDWEKYFNNKLNYQEVYDLVYKMPMKALDDLKKGAPTHPLLQKLGSGFYTSYKEGIDYLIEAKYLEPYMRINFIASPDSFYDSGSGDQNATELNYSKTISALQSLYNAAKNPEIKLRYGYQLIRFNHYNRKYKEAIEAYNQLVAPLHLNTDVYYLALNQLAGAQRGLGDLKAANWNFFQVFLHSASQKESAYTSMKFSDETSFKDLLNQTKTNDEKATAYFLLGYQNFNNPLPMMEKIYEINPQSELLQVLAARAVNELERSYLPIYYTANLDATSGTTSQAGIAPTSTAPQTQAPEKPGFFSRIWNYIKSLFSGSSTSSESTSTNTDLNNPNRIPFYNVYNEYQDTNENNKNYLSDLSKFLEKIKGQNDNEFWKITDAYVKFLGKDYQGSSDLLSSIKTENQDYLAQINKMKMLNDIVAQPVIDNTFEKHLYKDYKDYFVEKPKKEVNPNEDFEYSPDYPSTGDFLRDILANRYFLQGDMAKSFLMNNKMESFRYNPDLELAKKLQSFANKNDKNDFEKEIISKNMEGVGNLDAYFNVLYGDYAMKAANFEKAKTFYEKAADFAGYHLSDTQYDYNTGENKKIDTSQLYNGYKNISGLAFGHNHFVSYGSPVQETMRAESFVSEFPFIKNMMNKLELTSAAIELNKIGSGSDEKAAKANQLLGNLLYNTSALGYFRDLFVMDMDNSNGEKYRFNDTPFQFKIYFKNYSDNTFFKPDNFDLSLGYYEKALKAAQNPDQKAAILFQMASAEQGKFYLYQAKNDTVNLSYDDPQYDQKTKDIAQKIAQAKKEKFSSYFTLLKQDYAHTQTAKELRGSCSYFDNFMKR